VTHGLGSLSQSTATLILIVIIYYYYYWRTRPVTQGLGSRSQSVVTLIIIIVVIIILVHAPSSRHLRALLSVCGRCSFGGLRCCSCCVRVCRCRGCCSLSVCVCDLLRFLCTCPVTQGLGSLSQSRVPLIIILVMIILVAAAGTPSRQSVTD